MTALCDFCSGHTITTSHPHLMGDPNKIPDTYPEPGLQLVPLEAVSQEDLLEGFRQHGIVSIGSFSISRRNPKTGEIESHAPDCPTLGDPA